MKVYFGKNFWGHPKEEETPMEAIPLQQEFTWGELSGFIPALYVSEEGLVIDFCIRVPHEKVQDYFDKWRDKFTGAISAEEEEQICREHPLDIDFGLKLWVNGQELENVCGCGASYSKVIVGEYEKRYQKSFPKDCRELQLVQEYACEDVVSWCFKRYTCRWEHRPEKLEGIEIQFISGQKEYFGTPLEIGLEDAGRTFNIQNPVDDKLYQLYVCQGEQNALPAEIFNEHRELHERRMREKENNAEKCVESNPKLQCMEESEQRKVISEYQDAVEYPTHYLTISYEISATATNGVEEKLTYEKFSLKDGYRGDKARRLRKFQNSAVSVIVGSVDGPTSVFIAGKKTEEQKMLAVSSMHFEPVNKASWIPVFKETEREDMRLRIKLPKEQEW